MSNKCIVGAVVGTDQTGVAFRRKADAEFVFRIDQPADNYAGFGEIESTAKPERTAQHAGNATGAL